MGGRTTGGDGHTGATRSGEIWGDMGRYGELRSSRGESDSVMPPLRYTSNRHHPMSEGARMREDLEPLLLAAGTDLVLNAKTI